MQKAWRAGKPQAWLNSVSLEFARVTSLLPTRHRSFEKFPSFQGKGRTVSYSINSRPTEIKLIQCGHQTNPMGSDMHAGSELRTRRRRWHPCLSDSRCTLPSVERAASSCWGQSKTARS
eukprot:6207947-Pleurochrysis_carterae.AAC.3